MRKGARIYFKETVDGQYLTEQEQLYLSYHALYLIDSDKYEENEQVFNLLKKSLARRIEKSGGWEAYDKTIDALLS